MNFLEGSTNESHYTIRVSHRQTTFRETKQIRAYDLESLCGDIGGYMGLLLGYSILNMPTMILLCYGSIKRRLFDLKLLRTNDNKDCGTGDGYSSSSIRSMHEATSMEMNAIDDEHEIHDSTILKTSMARYHIMFEEFDSRLRSIEEQLK